MVNDLDSPGRQPVSKTSTVACMATIVHEFRGLGTSCRVVLTEFEVADVCIHQFS